MKTVTQNSMLCYTYNTKRCKRTEQNRRRIQFENFHKGLKS